MKPQPKPVAVPKAARIVAIEFPGYRTEQNTDGEDIPAGRLTVSAFQRHLGRIIVGPEFGLRGLVRRDKFIEELKVSELVFDPFQMDEKGRIKKQGSLINHIPGVRVCPECGEVWQLNHRLNKKAKMLGGGKYICNHPKCVEARMAQNLKPAELQWRWAPSSQIHPDDPIVEQMYQGFMVGSPALDEAALIPRVWGVYPVNRAPTDWVPEAGDAKALKIESRSRSAGRTVRPYNVTKAVQQDMLRAGQRNACKGLIVELTCDANGAYQPATGFMRPSTLIPETGTESRAFGYKLRLAGRKQKRRGNKAPVV